MCELSSLHPPRQEDYFLTFKNIRNGTFLISKDEKSIRSTTISFPRHIAYGKMIVVWFWHIPVLLVADSEMVKVWNTHFKVWNTHLISNIFFSTIMSIWVHNFFKQTISSQSSFVWTFGCCSKKISASVLDKCPVSNKHPSLRYQCY